MKTPEELAREVVATGTKGAHGLVARVAALIEQDRREVLEEYRRRMHREPGCQRVNDASMIAAARVLAEMLAELSAPPAPFFNIVSDPSVPPGYARIDGKLVQLPNPALDKRGYISAPPAARPLPDAICGGTFMQGGCGALVRSADGCPNCKPAAKPCANPQCFRGMIPVDPISDSIDEDYGREPCPDCNPTAKCDTCGGARYLDCSEFGAPVDIDRMACPDCAAHPTETEER